MIFWLVYPQRTLKCRDLNHFCPLLWVSSLQMWKSVVGHNVSMKVAAEGDDWETDPDFEVLCTSWCLHRLFVRTYSMNPAVSVF